MEKNQQNQLPSVKELVMNQSKAEFSHYRQGNFYYNINHVIFDFEGIGMTDTYQFPIADDDIGNGTLERTEKAITLMRWITQSLKDKTLIKL